MQLSDIRTEVLENAGLDSNDPRFASATLNRIINRALRRTSAEHDWPWLQTSETITTVVDDQDYAPTAGWFRTKRLRYQTDDLALLNANTAAAYTNTSGVPIGYFVEENQIHLIPKPAGVYSIEHIYLQIEPALSGDTDEPLLPDMYIDFLIAHATMLVATRLRDRELYALSDRDRKLWLDRMRDDVKQTRASLPVRARGDWPVVF